MKNLRLPSPALLITARNRAALHDARQRLNELLLLRNLKKKTARGKLSGLLGLIEHLRHTPLRRLAQTLASWL